MNNQKPRAVTSNNTRRPRHKRVASQPNFENISVNYRVIPKGTTSKKVPVLSRPATNQTKIDCSKFINYNIFNINGVMGNKAIMATTSPSFMVSTRNSSRVKTTAKSKRRKMQIPEPVKEETLLPNEVQDNESANDQFKLMFTESGPMTQRYNPASNTASRGEREIRSSMSGRTIEHQSIQKRDIGIQKMLASQIEETKKLNSTLRSRCSKLKEMLNVFDAQIQHDDQIVLKQRNIEQLHLLINGLSSSLMTTTETELNLGMKSRDLEYSQHEFKMLAGHYEALEKKHEILKREMQNQKLTVKEMQFREKDNLRNFVATRKTKEQMEARVHGLTEALHLVQEGSKLANYSKPIKPQLYPAGLSNQSLE